ncbi:TonB-dependent receptor [Winogradskyella alexanderae]|uniref:TonB-dependent receptor n=1 Tax=Winogradskyella alexanderae TaxID=2877123 RepID=A0ABS7XRL8_9FLAO|nr:TonB-dependent receptor [Winogradskyella alexanderae]MCA0132661.1 TonB-dependent receptor [Winogradskyella alexanderae]
MKYYSLIVLFSFCSFSIAQKCDAVFLGELKDFHDNTPLNGATIFIRSLNKYTSSDINGKFKIENLCNGELTLVITHLACETKTVTYNITGDMFQSIALEHHIEALNEVSVKAVVDKKETKTAQETIIKSGTLRRYSNLSIGDALKEVPGVSSINTGNTIVKPIINGLYGSRLLILNNNVRLQDQEWGVEHAPNIDINSANRISVIKGSGALAYGGDAVGGVIVINPARTILKDSLFGKTIVSGQTNSRGLSVSTILNKSFSSGWFANIQGSLKRNGDFEAPDYMLTNTGLRSNGITLQGGKKTFESGFEVFYSYLFNEIGILRSSHIGNISDLVNAINSQKPQVIDDFGYDINAPKQEVTHHLFKATYYKRFKNFGKINLQYDYQNNQRFEFDIRVGDDRDKPALDLNLQTHTLLADVQLDADLNRKTNFGLMGRYQDNFANPDTGIRRLIPDYDKYDFGAYLTSEWILNETFTLDAGLRYDFNRIDSKKFYRTSRWEERGYDNDFQDIIIASVYGTDIVYGVIDPDASDYLTNPVFNFHNFSASAGVRYNLNENSYLLGNYSLSSRPPNVSELFSDGLHHSAARIELGDLRLDQEISNRIALSYKLEQSNFDLLIEGYYNRISDFIYLRPTGVEQTIRGAFPVWEFQQTQAELFGIDVASNLNFNDNFTWRNKSSYIKGNDLSLGIDLIDMPAFNTINTLSYRNEKWNNFSANLTSEWVFEQKDFPDFNFEAFVPTTNETVLVDISTPPPAYHLLHFYSDVSFNISAKTNMNISLNINNVFNINYRAYLNRLRYFADDLGRNITLQLQINY